MKNNILILLVQAAKVEVKAHRNYVPNSSNKKSLANCFIHIHDTHMHT